MYVVVGTRKAGSWDGGDNGSSGSRLWQQQQRWWWKQQKQSEAMTAAEDGVEKEAAWAKAGATAAEVGEISS